MKVLFLWLVLNLTYAVTAQPLFLYRTAGNPGSYLLNRCTNDRDGFLSQVIIADTFRVQRKGYVCEVTMSNAFTYQTRLRGGLSSAKTNGVDQVRFQSGTITMDFSAGTEIIFNNACARLSELKIVGLGGTNQPNHEGEAAKRRTAKQKATNGK